jgi:hypothetical protein
MSLPKVVRLPPQALSTHIFEATKSQDCRLANTVVAYGAFVELYNVVGEVSHVEFQHMINQSNGVAQILIGHFLAVHAVLRPIAVHERAARDMSPLYKVLEPWVLRIHSELKPALKPFHAWPVSFIQEYAPMLDPKTEAIMAATRRTTYTEC